jgi:hypothetical protein
MIIHLASERQPSHAEFCCDLRRSARLRAVLAGRALVGKIANALCIAHRERQRSESTRALLGGAEPSHFGDEARDVVSGVGNEVDHGIEVGTWRSERLRPRVHGDVKLLVQDRIVAEAYEALAADPGTRFEEWSPGRRRDSERSHGAVFDLDKPGLFDAISHCHILPAIRVSTSHA